MGARLGAARTGRGRNRPAAINDDPSLGARAGASEASERLRLQWALEAYVRCSRAVIHFQGLDDLLSTVCAALVEDGRYVAAAVGLACGEDQTPMTIQAAAGPAAACLNGRTLVSTGRTLAGDASVAINGSLMETDAATWRTWAATYGIRSSAIFPFTRDGAVRGVLLVYASCPDAFGAQEIELFQELANEMAFGISVSDDRARLAETARDYKLLADNSSDIIVRYGPEQVVNYISPAVSQLGYRPEEVQGRSPLHLVHPDDHALLQSFDLHRSPVGAPGALLQLRLRHADGEWRWFEGRPRLMDAHPDAPGEAVVTLRDMTEQRRLELELRRRQAEAEAGTRAKSEFLANMSHEIRTPLTAIVGFADLLRETPGLPAQQLDYANRIAVAGQSLHAMVDQILDFSSVDAGRIALDPQPFDPAEMTDVTLAMLAEPARTKGLRLARDGADALPASVLADSGRIRQVLIALLDNALKFTDAGEILVSVTYDAEAEALRFEVRDTGIGIPVEQGRALFESFSQGDGSVTRRHGGVGLGLAIARSVVERLGGEIGYASRKSRGSTFWFSVPAPLSKAAPGAPPTRATSDAPPLRVLVADDAPVNCELVGALLSAAGYDVSFANDGQEAVALASLAPYDLILMDMQMPVMDGPSAARAIRSGDGLNADTPIIAVSANVLPMHVQLCLQAGMDDHIPKPIGLHSLMTKVDQWAGRERAG